MMESDNSKYAISKLDTISDRIYTELGVPSNARAVDILSFPYKIKKGMPKACTRGFDTALYDNYEFKIFTDAENIYLADLEEKYRFPLSSLCAIRMVKECISIPSWNNETEPKKGIYKQYN